jgi:hypothetical protein
VLYNRFGRRLDSVGEKRETDIYEEGRAALDLAVTQRLRDRVRAKFTIKNILGEDEELTYGENEDVFSRIVKGTVYTLNLSFDL